MTATLQPQGLVPTRHPSGTIRIENLIDGVLSGYTSNIFTGTPIMRGTDGTLQVTTGVAGACIGVFQGCEFSASGKRFLLPYFPANQTYDAGSMIAKFTADADIIYEAQSSGSLAAVAVGEGVNVSAVSGATSHGFSSQTVGAATGATAASFTILALAPYDDNAWGDAFTKVLVQIQTKQAPVAREATAPGAEDMQRREEEEAKREEVLKQRREEDAKRLGDRREEDKRREDERREEDKRLEAERLQRDEEEAKRREEAAQLPADQRPAPEPYPAYPGQPQP